jgi:decaprenylphospho-beta-D-ribofuranose 2-oxidase
MQISGWGKYPIVEASVCRPQNLRQVRNCLGEGFSGIARGMGRSYGDSSLAPQVIDALPLDHILAFDSETGIVTCQAGVTLAELLSIFVPKGWFLPVTPGTKFVSVGGAIASDVHGKNHHIDGSFTDHVLELHVMLADGSVVACSPEQNSELFHATCGGMGLTGVILQASFRLKPINSAFINETTYKAPNLETILELFEQYADSTYSVAWIDCSSRGRHMGRSLLMLGEHAREDLECHATGKSLLTLPVELPSATLNRYTIRAFNNLYYHRILRSRRERRIHYEPYFYPLDSINHWNRLYGKQGFTQYQFVLPTEAGRQGLQTILKHIVDSRRGSFLSVLKAFGPENENYISFPKAGYTLALDFKLDTGIFEFLNELDRIVLDYGGRLYLTKDVRMDETLFKQSYPKWQQFQEVRKKTGAMETFNSLQSQRLGI